MLKGADIRFGIAGHMMDPLGLNVRRQGFWNQRRLKLRESLAHLVFILCGALAVMQAACFECLLFDPFPLF